VRGRHAKLTHILFGLAAGAAATASDAQICAPFTDVAASSGFCSNIQWLFNRDIIEGCTATQYCPANFVRRDQMAAFINRLADNAVFQQGGNAFGETAVLGTSDARAVEIVAEGQRAFRVWYVPADANPAGVNVLAGTSNNVIACTGLSCQLGSVPAVRGGTIAGGGAPETGAAWRDRSGWLYQCGEGAFSFAAGIGARASASRCFVCSDASSTLATQCKHPESVPGAGDRRV
jgi:hypothetical protein